MAGDFAAIQNWETAELGRLFESRDPKAPGATDYFFFGLLAA